MSNEEYNLTAKALGGEFCDFLVDRGSMGGKTLVKSAMLGYL